MSSWPLAAAPEAAVRGLPDKSVQNSRDRDDSLYAHLEKHTLETTPSSERRIQSQELDDAIRAIRRLRPDEFADPKLWEELSRVASRTHDQKDLKWATMGCRMVKMIIDVNRQDEFVKGRKLSGEVKVNGEMVIKDFSVSADPAVNRKRVRRGQICRFWKQEPMKKWGDFTNDDFESTPAGPIFTGDYMGWIGGIGDDGIYVFPFESKQQRGIEAVRPELKSCYHMAYSEGARYQQGNEEGRPVFTIGLGDYQGSMLSTEYPRHVAFAEYIGLIPGARLTDESHVYVSDQVPNYLKPEKFEHRQILISEADQDWYRKAGCPESGMTYVKNKDGMLKVTSLTSTSPSYRPAPSSLPAKPKSQGECDTHINSRAEKLLEIIGGKNFTDAQSESNDGRNVRYHNATIPRTPDTSTETTTDTIGRPYKTEDRAIESGNQRASKSNVQAPKSKKPVALRQNTVDARVNKRQAPSKPFSLPGDPRAHWMTTNLPSEIASSEFSHVHPSRAKNVTTTTTGTANSYTTNRLGKRNINGSVKSGQTQAGAETTPLKQTTNILATQKLGDGSTRDPRLRN